MSAAKKASSAACESPDRKVTCWSYWPAPAVLFWWETRTEPTGTETALRMLLGGSPPFTIGDSIRAAGTARRVTPGTPTAAPECLTGAGACDVTIAMVTKTTRISAASPNTIMAGRMEIPPGTGGRCGSGASPPSARSSVSCRVMAPESLRRSRPPEMVEGAVPGAEPPGRAAGQCPRHEELALR